jgi:hypothetical protein
MMTRAPVILYVGVGIDESYRIFGWTDFATRIIGHSKYRLPLMMGIGAIPLPVKLVYRFSEPILLEGTPEDADNPEVVARNHERLRIRGQLLLDEGLRQRRSLYFG